MDQRIRMQKAIRDNYAILLNEFKDTYCATCKWYESHQGCEKALLPITGKGEACPYHQLRNDEALQSKSTGIELRV